jgi:hypothetical protein
MFIYDRQEGISLPLRRTGGEGDNPLASGRKELIQVRKIDRALNGRVTLAGFFIVAGIMHFVMPGVCSHRAPGFPASTAAGLAQRHC